MVNDYKYTKQGKEDMDKSVVDMEEKNNVIMQKSNTLMDDINKEGNFYEAYSDSISTLYDNLIDQFSEINNAWSQRLVLILICYGILFLVYRYTLFMYFMNHQFEPIMYLVLLSSSTYIVEKKAMTELTKWSNNKIQKLKNNIKNTEIKGTNNIRLLNNKNRINQLISSVKEIIGVTALFSGKIDRLLNYMEHQNLSKRIKNSVLVCSKRYNFILNHMQINEISEPSFDLKNEHELRIFYLNEFSTIFNINKNIISLLYFEYIGDNELLNIEWDKIKEHYNLIDLMKNLYKRKLIVDYSFMNEKIIIHLLNNLKSFSLSEINNAISNYKRFKDITEIYIEGTFEENMINEFFSFNYEYLYDKTFDYYSDNYKLEFYYNLLTKYLTIVFKNSHKSYDDSVIKTLIGLISAKKYPWLIKISCMKISVDKRAANLVFIYQRLKENRDGEVTFLDALNVKSEFVQRQMSDYNLAREEMILDLRAGKWINNTETVLKRKMDYIKNTLESIDHSEKQIQSIKRIFSSYTSEKTIMHSIDSKTLIAYVINGKHEHGKGGVMPLIDQLKDYPGYWFNNFTTSTRIGILPPNMDFLTFSTKFEKDIIKIVDSDVGNIVIQRFSTSEYNTKQIALGTGYEPPWKIIRQLASEHLSEDQLRIVFTYGELIDDSFLNRPIVEILGEYIHNNHRVNEESVKATLSKTDILSIILNTYKCNNLREFTDYLNKKQNKSVLINELTMIFRTNYSTLELIMIEKLVIEFFNILEDYYHAYGELELKI
ncbi:MAG: hypothetical protein HQ541_12495 [Mariniphaga sp.]|nr:hypothetical protein [Mariniphaga sp.]